MDHPSEIFGPPEKISEAVVRRPCTGRRRLGRVGGFCRQGQNVDKTSVRFDGDPDLRVYVQSLGAHLFYYGGSECLEADAEIDGLDGRWAAVEIKLAGRSLSPRPANRFGPFAHRSTPPAAESRHLIVATTFGHAMADRWNTVGNLPARLIVLTAFGHGYQTLDGIAVIPRTALKP